MRRERKLESWEMEEMLGRERDKRRGGREGRGGGEGGRERLF